MFQGFIATHTFRDSLERLPGPRMLVLLAGLKVEGYTAGPARKKDPATGVCRKSAFFQVSSVLCLGKVGRGCSGHTVSSSSQECPEFLPGKNTFNSKARASVEDWSCRLPATQHNSRYPGRKELFTINHIVVQTV